MAQFRLLETPPYGVCLTCGTSACTNGFVDLIASTKVVRDSYEIVGDVDIILCADCVEQASNLIGALSKAESDFLFADLVNTRDRYSKAADESAAWQQRYENLVEIMSLLELKSKASDSSEASLLELEKNDNPPDLPEFGAGAFPQPDLRVQEGSSEALSTSGKKQSSSGKPRGRTNR